MTRPFVLNRIVVRGAGEMASGVIHRLATAGCEVIALERPSPTCIRRHVCFAEAYYKKRATVASVSAVLVDSPEDAIALAASGEVPLLIDPDAAFLSILTPLAVIDGRMLKEDVRADINLAPVTIGLGPGFIAGVNCRAIVETNRGSDLGQVIYNGPSQAYTGIPTPVSGYDLQRVLRSPADGIFLSRRRITDIVKAGQSVGEVSGIKVTSHIDGIIRGLIHNGLSVTSGMKIGDIDPRGLEEYCYSISDKARAVGEGVLEAIRTLKTRIIENNPGLSRS